MTSISNGPFAGLGFTVAPGARLDDGLLDVRVFERFSRWELVRHFWSIAAGRRRYEPRVRTLRSATVQPPRREPAARPRRRRGGGHDAGGAAGPAGRAAGHRPRLTDSRTPGRGPVGRWAAFVRVGCPADDRAGDQDASGSMTAKVENMPSARFGTPVGIAIGSGLAGAVVVPFASRSTIA